MNIELQEKIIARIHECYDIADKRLGRTFARPEILFDLRGTCAGRAIMRRDFTGRKIRINKVLAAENEEKFLATSIPHECAHLISFDYYNSFRAHGREWKSIMLNVFGLAPERCHTYDVSNARVRRVFAYRYRCDCQDGILISSKHHSIVQNEPLRLVKCVRCHHVLSEDDFLKKVEKRSAG